MKLEDMEGVRQENAAFELCVRNLERMSSAEGRARVVEMLQRHLPSMSSRSEGEDPRQTAIEGVIGPSDMNSTHPPDVAIG